MALHVRFFLAAVLLFLSSPRVALPFQAASSEPPVIEPRKRPEPRLGISPDMPEAALPRPTSAPMRPWCWYPRT